MEKKFKLTDLPNVGPGTSEKLEEAGISSVISVAVSTPGLLKDACGITETSARKIIKAAREKCELGFEIGTDIDEKEKTIKKISFHCDSINELLDGGLELGTTMECYGEYASGKSCIAHLLAVSTIKQFPNSYVIWVDTEKTFRPSRIRAFCEGLEMDADEVLKHIKVGKAVTSDHQILLTETVEKEINAGNDVKLVIIDSLMNHFRAEYLGRGTLSVRQQTINGYLHKIGKLADIYDLSVYMTNQVQSNPGLAFGDPNKPIGGNVVAHFATTRLYIRKMSKNIRKMLLVDSPNLAPGEAIFTIEGDKLGSEEEK